MWLLNITDTPGSAPIIKLEYHVGSCPQYAILSHRWGAPSDEVSFQDLQNDLTIARAKAGYRKVEQCCIKALEIGLQYAWIDTCCIDKSSSAELSEAINSMYAWYWDAQICFAYLDDVLATHSDADFEQRFKKSSWFTRGWTLQELLAPPQMIFFTADWCRVEESNRFSLRGLIHDITSIPFICLYDRHVISQASIAQKMSWASKRVTTRVEDESYCLMGLFGVHIPIIYGEGRHAFQRLQEEIMRTTPDHSIFAWCNPPTPYFGDHLPILAERPAQFLDSSKYMPVDIRHFDRRFGAGSPDYAMTNLGVRIDLPICPLPGAPEGTCVAFIACEREGEPKFCKEVGLILRQRADRPDGHFSRVEFNEQVLLSSREDILGLPRFSTQRGLIWIMARVENIIYAPAATGF